jgi:hypothetical protein
MSLESEQMRKTYSGNGTTTTFSFPWAFLDATDLDVYLVDEAGAVLGTAGAEFFQTFVSQYDIVGAYAPLTNDYTDFSTGASVNFVTAPATGYTVIILRNNPDTQDSVLVGNNAYPPAVLEYALDKIVMMIQFLTDRSSRSIRLSDANPSLIDPKMPNPVVASSILTTASDALSFSWMTITALAQAAANLVTATIGIVNAYFVTGSIGETSMVIVNNQVAAANVTGLLFNGASVRAAEIYMTFYIYTTLAGATELAASSKYLAVYKANAATWDITSLGVVGDVTSSQPAGITISITNAGQVQYTSTNVTGTANTSKMTFKAIAMGV